jgi:hypothetical protein
LCAAGDSDYDNDEGQASEDEEMPQEDDTHTKKASRPAKTAVDEGEDGKVSEEAEEINNEPDCELNLCLCAGYPNDTT